MILPALALLQSAAALPDIELQARVQARSLTIEKQGEASLAVHADGQTIVDVQAPKADGRKRIANPRITVDVKASIRDPLDPAGPTTPPR